MSRSTGKGTQPATHRGLQTRAILRVDAGTTRCLGPGLTCSSAQGPRGASAVTLQPRTTFPQQLPGVRCHPCPTLVQTGSARAVQTSLACFQDPAVDRPPLEGRCCAER